MLRTLFATLLFASLISAGKAQAPQNAAPTGDDAAAVPTFEAAQQLAGRGRLDKAMEQLNQLATQTPEPAGVGLCPAPRGAAESKLRHRPSVLRWRCSGHPPG